MIANLYLQSDTQGKIIGAKVIIGTMEFPLELGSQPVNVLADLLKPKIDAVVEEKLRRLAAQSPDTAMPKVPQELTDIAVAYSYDRPQPDAKETMDKVTQTLWQYGFWPQIIA